MGAPMKHVTILGLAPGVPRWIPRGEVWCPNLPPRRPDLRRRLTRVFQLHPMRVLIDRELDWLVRAPVPIYTQHRIRLRGIRRTRVYPLASIPAGPLSSSFDYMLALALLERFDRILLAGITLQRGSLRERLCEHVSLAYWIGLARGRGCRVTIAPGCQILRAPFRYGLDY